VESDQSNSGFLVVTVCPFVGVVRLNGVGALLLVTYSHHSVDVVVAA